MFIILLFCGLNMFSQTISVPSTMNQGSTITPSFGIPPSCYLNNCSFKNIEYTVLDENKKVVKKITSGNGTAIRLSCSDVSLNGRFYLKVTELSVFCSDSNTTCKVPYNATSSLVTMKNGQVPTPASLTFKVDNNCTSPSVTYTASSGFDNYWWYKRVGNVFTELARTSGNSKAFTGLKNGDNICVRVLKNSGYCKNISGYKSKVVSGISIAAKPVIRSVKTKDGSSSFCQNGEQPVFYIDVLNSSLYKFSVLSSSGNVASPEVLKDVPSFEFPLSLPPGAYKIKAVAIGSDNNCSSVKYVDAKITGPGAPRILDSSVLEVDQGEPVIIDYYLMNPGVFMVYSNLETAAMIDGASNNAAQSRFTIDSSKLEGVISLYAKVTDNDGCESKIIRFSIKVNPPTLGNVSFLENQLEDSVFSFYPNPVKESLNLKLSVPNSTQVVLNIYSINGVALFTKAFSATKGENTYSWSNPLVNYPGHGAVYIAILEYNGKQKAYKLIKE